MYITASNKILVLNPETEQITTQIPSNQSEGYKITFNSYDNNMYVLHRQSGTVSVIDSKLNVVTKIIKLEALEDIALNPINMVLFYIVKYAVYYEPN